MRKRFDIFLRSGAAALAKFHAQAVQTDAKGNEVMLESGHCVAWSPALYSPVR